MIEENSKEEFISIMNKLTSGVFEEAINKCKNGLMLDDGLEPLKPSRENTFIKFVLSDEKDPMGDYAAQIDENAANANHDKWIVIESLSHTTSSSSAGLPMEQFSLNYSEIKSLQEVFKLIMKHQSPEVLDNEVEKFIKSNQNVTVMLGLLVPAVQRIREASPRHSSLMNTALAGEIFNGKLPDSMPLLLQYQRAAAFLGGLELIVSEDYDNSTLNAASINTLHAMYQNTMTMLWAQVWDHYN